MFYLPIDYNQFYDLDVHAEETPKDVLKAFLVETISRKVIQVNDDFIKLFKINITEEDLVGQNSVPLLLNISQKIADVEAFGFFYSMALENRKGNQINHIKLNYNTELTVKYSYNQQFAYHFWEFTNSPIRKAS
ncbi:MAG: hypothetical protein WCO54_04055 [Bacteroidota bacterium]